MDIYSYLARSTSSTQYHVMIHLILLKSAQCLVRKKVARGQGKGDCFMERRLECRWASCPRQVRLCDSLLVRHSVLVHAVQGSAFSTPEELAMHVEYAHVDPCADHDLFICQWEGCKVYNRASYSFGWLQRHVRQLHTKVSSI